MDGVEKELKSLPDGNAAQKRADKSLSTAGLIFVMAFYCIGAFLIIASIAMMLEIEESPRHATKLVVESIIFAIFGVGSIIYARLSH